jgi:hypothetical protein
MRCTSNHLVGAMKLGLSFTSNNTDRLAPDGDYSWTIISCDFRIQRRFLKATISRYPAAFVALIQNSQTAPYRIIEYHRSFPHLLYACIFLISIRIDVEFECAGRQVCISNSSI